MRKVSKIGGKAGMLGFTKAKRRNCSKEGELTLSDVPENLSKVRF